MMRLAGLAALALATVAPPAAGDAPRLPAIAARDLNDKAISLPDQLPGARTLLLVAFRQQQQYDVDTWIDGMGLRDGSLPWLELPVVPNYGALFRWYLDNGMRAGIRDGAARARVVTLYTDPAAFRASLGLPDGERIYAVVADRSGRVVHVAAGRHTVEKETGVRTALGN